MQPFDIQSRTRFIFGAGALERLGAVREGVLRRHYRLWDGHRRDSVYYSVIEEEWPDVRGRLDAGLAP